MLFYHHLFELCTLYFSVAELFWSSFDATESIIDILVDSWKLFGDWIISFRHHIFCFLVRNQHHWIIYCVTSLYLVVLLDSIINSLLYSIINSLYFLMRNGVITINIWAFEVYLREKTFMIGESSTTVRNLSDFIIDNHT